MYQTLRAEQFRDRLDSGEQFTVVDTRGDESFESWRIADSIQYFYKPFHEFDLDDFEAETGLGPTDSIVTMCAKGKASDSLAAELADAGYENVAVVEDGMEAWSGVYDHVTIEYDDFTSSNSSDAPRAVWAM